MTKDKIRSICNENGIRNYTINDDMSIDVDTELNLSFKKIEKIPLVFNIVNDSFKISSNTISSLKGSPMVVKGNFHCGFNKLESLEGSPFIVSGNFSCIDNSIKSFSGISEIIEGNLYCYNNNIRDFKGYPQYVGGTCTIGGNPVYEIYKLFWNKKCIEFINEYDVIQGDSVIMDNLEKVYSKLDIKIPNKLEIKNYNIV